LKNIYAIQPYEVGSKERKSLAIVIPAQITKKYKIDTSTIFALKADDSTRIVTLQTVPKLSGIRNNRGIPAGGFEGPCQQVSSEEAQ
jgi:hypothetical protein